MFRNLVHYLRSAAGGPILDLLLPPFCVLCGPARQEGETAGLCRDCAADLESLRVDQACALCAVPLGPTLRAQGERCSRCRNKHAAYRSVRAAGLYDGVLRDLIVGLKYAKKSACARPLVDLLAEDARAGPARGEAAPTLVAAVPLTARRLRERGFNQAALLAEGPALALGIPIVACLERTDDREPQAALSRHGRLGLGPDAFRADSSKVFGRRILVVDDVLTTGATFRAVARVLADAGALEVRCLAAARAGDS